MDNNNNNNNNNKKMKSKATEIPEELVHKITLMSYKLSPHPTAKIITNYVKEHSWCGHDDFDIVFKTCACRFKKREYPPYKHLVLLRDHDRLMNKWGETDNKELNKQLDDEMEKVWERICDLRDKWRDDDGFIVFNTD